VLSMLKAKTVPECHSVPKVPFLQALQAFKEIPANKPGSIHCLAMYSRWTSTPERSPSHSTQFVGLVCFHFTFSGRGETSVLDLRDWLDR